MLGAEKDGIRVCHVDSELTVITAVLTECEGMCLAETVRRECADPNKVTLVILSLPLVEEGERAVLEALRKVADIRKYPDGIMLRNKERLRRSGWKPPHLSWILDLYMVPKIVEELKELVATDGSEAKRRLRKCGTFEIFSGFASVEEGISDAIRHALIAPYYINCDYYSNCDLSSARTVWLKVILREDYEVTPEDEAAIRKFLKGFKPWTDVKTTLERRPSTDHPITVTILATVTDATPSGG